MAASSRSRSACTDSRRISPARARGSAPGRLGHKSEKSGNRPGSVVQPLRPGQECWQLMAQWVWALRLEPGHQLHLDPARTTEFAPALLPSSPHTAPASGYAPRHVDSSWKRVTSRTKTWSSPLMDAPLSLVANQRKSPHLCLTSATPLPSLDRGGSLKQERQMTPFLSQAWNHLYSQ